MMLQFEAAKQQWGVLEWAAATRSLAAGADDSAALGGENGEGPPVSKSPAPLRPVKLLALHGYPGSIGRASVVAHPLWLCATRELTL